MGGFFGKVAAVMALPGLIPIAKDLRKVVKFGLGAMPDSEQLPTLATLLVVRQRIQGATTLDAIMAIEGVIREAIETLDGTPLHGALQLLFGLTPATTGALAKQRRRAAADAVGTDPGTFNRHDEQRLLRLLARRIYALETDAYLTQDRLGEPPTTDEQRASWLERFTHYLRIQAILRQLRLDLIAALLTYSSHAEDQTGRDDYLDSSIWQYARFLSIHDEFVDRLGAMWLMPEPSADAEAKTSIDLALWHGPFNERGRSWLRTAIAQVPRAELHPFVQRLRDGPDGTELLGLWEAWLEDCRCDPDRPEPACRPHQVIDQCERYDLLVDQQWTLIREAYRDLPAN